MDNKKERKVAESLIYSDDYVQLFFSEKAFKKMIFLVMACSKEVGWHGFVRKLGKGIYYVDDIILYPQETTAATIRCDTAQYGLWQQNICIENPELFEMMRLHGHSHVNMACRPSSVDIDLQDDGIEMIQENGFYIYMIFNKKADRYIKIADREYGVIYEDVALTFDDKCLSELVDDYRSLVRKEERYGHK